MSILFKPQDKSDTNYVKLAQKLYCSLQGNDRFKTSPLRLLLEQTTVYPEFVPFHLRELYLRQNLSFSHNGNRLVFKHLNEGYLHDYIAYLMA
jgi:hypothetical protein